jgi:hypothetical protein
MTLDIAFSDHALSKSELESFGKVVQAIHSVCEDEQECFWAFIRFVSVHHSDILGVKISPENQQRLDEILSQAKPPQVAREPTP